MKPATRKIKEPFIFSQSSLQDYVDCPRRFHLRHIDHLEWPAVETEPILEYERHQQEGQLFHRLAQQALIGLPGEKISPLANTENLLQWWTSFSNSLLKLLSAESDEHTSLYTEFTLSAPILDQRLMAKYDLLITKQNQAVIYDWKTNLKRPKDEWLSGRLQTRVYRYLLAAAGTQLNQGSPFAADQIEMTYWFANFPLQPATFPYTSIQYSRDRSAIETLIREIIQTEDFPLTDDDKKCRFCGYRTYCERAVKIGSWKDDSSGYVEDDLSDPDINLEQIAEVEF